MSDRDWHEYAGEAISRELDDWQQNMKHVCRDIDADSRYQVAEAPWVKQFAWLNLALTGATLVPQLAAPAYLAMIASSLAAEGMQRSYGRDVNLTRAFLEQQHKGVLAHYFQVIDGVARSFFSNPQTVPIARTMRQVLGGLITTQAAEWIRADCVDSGMGGVDRQKAISHLRRVILHSGVLPTSYSFLRHQVIEKGFAAIYDNIWEIARRSDLVPPRFREHGVVYQPYSGEPIAGLSGQPEEICVKNRIYAPAGRFSRCDLTFKAVRAQSRSDFLVILNDPWQFDVELEPAKLVVPTMPPATMAIKHVRVRQRKNESLFAANRVPTTYETRQALERGFKQYARTGQAAA